MKIGIVYPQIELGGDPQAVRRIGLAVEELGYDSLMMYDHVVGAAHENRQPRLTGPYTENDPFHDPFVAFAYLAAITTRIEFFTGILILPQRQTVLAAQQAADLDLLSGERLQLGVGTGWNYVEYDALGQDFAVRGKRLTEQVEFMRKLWTSPLVTFKGEYDQIDRGCINPRPKRSIPVWFGGFGEPPMKRAARMGDGFIFTGLLDDVEGNSRYSGVLSKWQYLQTLLKENDRSTKDFGVNWSTMVGQDVDTVTSQLKRWEDAGGTHASVVTMGMNFKTIDEHIDYIAELARKLNLQP